MSVKVEVWGNYALFTRPEMKVERVSYDVMTPSAARGILEAIYWHPGMKWIVDSIQICNSIRFTNVRRNEVKEKVKRPTKEQLKSEKGELQYISTQDSIVQRASLLLTDVRYVITAHFEMTSNAAEGDNPGKFQDIIKRRLAKGQHYYQPYLGCREFAANFKENIKQIDCPEELKGTKDLGFMLYDLDYSDPEDVKPMFFRATMTDGLIKIPDVNSKEVLR